MSKNPLSLLVNAFSSVFGKLNWRSPPWINYLCNQSKSSPKKFWGRSAIVILLLIIGGYTAYWYKNLPQPIYTTAQITVPEITPNTEEQLVPNNLIIDFGIKSNVFVNQSVAPLSQIGKTITNGIEMTPNMPGTWIWNTDSQLVFTPSEDWPAGQKFTLHFASNFFASTAKMERYEYSFSTHPFTAKIIEFKLYQDPVHAETRNAVVTVEFNYPVNPQSLEKNTTLAYAKAKSGAVSQHLPFTITYDKNKRVAYVHSETVHIDDVARFLRLALGKDVSSSTNSGHLYQEIAQNLLIPSTQDFLKILSANASIVRNAQDRPEQVLTVESTLGINENEFNKAVHFYLLPKNRPATAAEKAKTNYQWQNQGEVTQAVLALATPLTKETIPSEQNYSTIHSFKFKAETTRYIYVKIDKGMQGFGGFTLGNDYAAVIPVPTIPKEISFLHKGSLLSLSGEKKLSVLVRGVPAVKFDFARVLPENVNQLVTQTQGDFNNPYFINPTFNQQNISQISSDIQEFDASDLAKQQYTALDFSKYLAMSSNTLRPQGLFLLQATGWDVDNKTALDVKASRMILITDLALLVKDNNDGSHDVFVNSITQGAPVANATVTVLGKNGLSILSRVSDAQGRVTFPTMKDFVDDREPTVYLAKLNNDVSFITFNNANRQLNFSKFDIGGIYTSNQELHSLSAYLFSDRGIYRPGDTVHVGMIVKQAFAQSQPAGLPLQATVVDARGTTIKDEKITLNDTGYLDLDFATNATSPTGQYMINLYLVKDGYPQNFLGSTNIRISEFLPDRMRITTNLSPKPAAGWSSPADLKGEVSLWNLYGAPAVDRKVSAKVLLVPQKVQFDKFPDYVFVDPLLDPKKPPKVFTETLADTKTNAKGEAIFDLNLARFEKATYQLTCFAEGFESEGGRSVTNQSKALISPLPYFVGYKADGDLSFIKQNSARSINYIAVNPELNQAEVKDLKIQLVSLHPVTTLVKKADGTYQYQSVIQSTIVSSTPLNISEQGSNYALPTQQIGDFSLSILDKDDTVLNQLKFSVVGASQQSLSKNAELSIKLNKPEYQANEDIEIQITAPYTGSGLITIERDKVYAAQWFKTDTTNSVQTIRIPADFQGNGYINVAFIRDWNSPEIFISPLSYSVLPFAVNHDNHDIKIDLQTAATARPGEPFTIDYHTDKPGKIIVFAVDEGILQVARYQTPDPLSFFFQKHALEVLTQQTVDQIMPQFIQDRELSAVGGDNGEEGMASRLNPFKRKTEAPVVYWSGILDADTTTKQLVYQVPDYFNGTLRVMAVAVATDSVGSQEKSSEIRGDFIINPNVPTFAAPGDEFVISASIANNVKGSGKNALVHVDLTASPELEILGAATQTVQISEGQEQTVHYKVKAKSLLGAANLSFKASMDNKTSTMSASLSVRPAMPLSTFITSGKTDEAQKTLDIMQTLYPEYRQVNATVSTSPMILVFGLQRYLDNYPYGCTEQLTSKVLPLLAMNNQTGFTDETKKINAKVNETVQMLSQRQMSNGGFSYWPGLGDNHGNDFATVYAMHFLTEAKAQWFNIPNDMFFNGINYLKTLASQSVSDLEGARIQAYAIYILTRNEIVTTNYLANLQLYLEKDKAKAWQTDITSAYIAASYQLLQSHDEANQLIGLYKPQSNQAYFNDFYDSAIADAQYLYLVAKHFPNLLPQVGDELLMRLIQAINTNEINTVLSGYTSLALWAYQYIGSNNSNTILSLTKIKTDNQETNVPVGQGTYQKVDIDANTLKVRFNNPDKKTFFYQLMQSGFDRVTPNTPLKHGLEIFREYKDAKGNVVTSTPLGSEIEVHIQIRAMNTDYLSNIAIEDLLPGGFEVVSDSLKNNTAMDYIDAREDRVNFFGDVTSSAKEIVYKIKAVNVGQYIVPPAYAEAMYDPTTKAHGASSAITVTETP
ncbi:MAG: alpha-2-macroglobulin [Legionella sp.]